MNLLEQYIKEIHSEKPYEEDWTKQYDEAFVQAEVTTNCYGNITRNIVVYPEKKWEEIKQKGYYMA